MMRHLGMVICLPYFQFVSPPIGGLTLGANIHVCANVSLFSSYQVAQDCSVLMANDLHASVHGVGTVDLKFTSGKIVQLKNVQYVPAVKKNLVSVSLLCKEGFKLVFESNKVVVSRYGLFVRKGYDCGGLFRLSLEVSVIKS